MHFNTAILREMGRDFCQTLYSFQCSSEHSKNIDLKINHINDLESGDPKSQTNWKNFDKKTLMSDLAVELEQQKKIKREKRFAAAKVRKEKEDNVNVSSNNVNNSISLNQYIEEEELKEEEGDEEGSEGSDSEPSFDNFDNEQLVKLLPTHAKKKSK
jgi:hypothetical protein